MNLRNVHVPQFIKFTYALEELEKLLVGMLHDRDTRLPALVIDPILFQKDELVALREFLEQSLDEFLMYKCDSAVLEFAQEIQRELIASSSDTVIAIGGGQTLDVGKYVAAQNDLPFISVPTQVSHDGIASPVAVLRMDSQRYSLSARMPMAVFIDIPTIRAAPRQRLCAGIGDVVSNLTAVHDWLFGAAQEKEVLDDFAALLSGYAARSVLHHRNPDLECDEFVEDIVRALVLSGIAMEIAGRSKPCSGVEHLISHSIDSLYPEKSLLHGQQVALGTIIAAYLHNMNWQEIKAFFRSVGLPTTAEDMGLSADELVKVIQHAPETRPQRFTLLNTLELSRSFILSMLEEMGMLT